MANNYNIVLGAQISPAGLQNVENQIKQLSKKFKLNIEIQANAANINKQIQQQIKKSRTQLQIEDITGITQSEDKKAKAYVSMWKKAEFDRNINREKEEQKSYVNTWKRQIKLVADREKLEKAATAAQIKNAEKVNDFMSNQSNALKRSVAGREDLLSKNGLRNEYDAIQADLAKMSSVGGKSISEMRKNIDNFKTRLRETQTAIKNTTKDGYNFGEMISVAAKKIAIWAISTGLIYGSLNQIKKGIVYIQDLDNALNEIRIVTGQSQKQISSLAYEYNNLARQMKVTTTETVKVSAELYRQGLSAAAVEERLKAIIKYAKISGIGLEESNKIITATANATERSVEDIIDVFALLGDTTALNFLPSAV